MTSPTGKRAVRAAREAHHQKELVRACVRVYVLVCALDLGTCARVLDLGACVCVCPHSLMRLVVFRCFSDGLMAVMRARAIY